MEMAPKRKGHPRLHPVGSATAKNTTKVRTDGSADGVLRKQLLLLYRCLMDFIMDDGQQPITVFMEFMFEQCNN